MIPHASASTHWANFFWLFTALSLLNVALSFLSFRFSTSAMLSNKELTSASQGEVRACVLSSPLFEKTYETRQKKRKKSRSHVFKPPPPVGAGGGYMFSGRPSVRPSVIHVVVLCFRYISSICWRIFAKLLSLVHLGTQMTWLRFWVKRSKFKVTPSRQRRTALDGSVECNFF